MVQIYLLTLLINLKVIRLNVKIYIGQHLKKNIHVYLDEFLEIISDFQDSIAEDYQGILGKMQPNAIKGITCDCLNALDFIDEVKMCALSFYDKIPQESIYVGIKSECEVFIHNINKYRYLFNLCDIRPY